MGGNSCKSQLWYYAHNLKPLPKHTHHLITITLHACPRPLAPHFHAQHQYIYQRSKTLLNLLLPDDHGQVSCLMRSPGPSRLGCIWITSEGWDINVIGAMGSLACPITDVNNRELRRKPHWRKTQSARPGKFFRLKLSATRPKPRVPVRMHIQNAPPPTCAPRTTKGGHAVARAMDVAMAAITCVHAMLCAYQHYRKAKTCP